MAYRFEQELERSYKTELEVGYWMEASDDESRTVNERAFRFLDTVE